MKRPPPSAWAVVGLLLFILYAVGGVGGIRQVRSRIRAWLEPPTVEQVQRAGPDTVISRAAAPLRETVRGKVWLSDPPSPASIAIVLAAILSSAMLLMYFTGRSSPHKSR